MPQEGGCAIHGLLFPMYIFNMDYNSESSFLERVNKFRGAGVQVIRGIPYGKHVLPAVICISRGALHLRRSYWYKPNRIVHSRKVVKSWVVWYLS